MKSDTIRVDALAIADGDGFCASPGSLLIGRRAEQGRGRPIMRLLAAGSPAEIDAHPAAPTAERLNKTRHVLIPGLVNAHTHLDLSTVGPLEHDPDDGFVSWVDRIRTERSARESDIGAAVRRGVELSLAGGVVAVGDIAGAPGGEPTLTPWRTLSDSPVLGVSFLEFFAIGRAETRSLGRVEAVLDSIDGPDRNGVRLGLQPHAPNTVSLDAYRWAAARATRQGLPLSTHLAETPEERVFIASGTGPQRDLLQRVGAWDDRILDSIGRGLHPVDHLAHVLDEAPFLLAHVNDAPDAAIERLARTRASVAYCPRASAYFGAERHFGPHRYRDMLSAGVNVALGTDSLANLPDAAATTDGGGMSVLDEMRLLYRRDGTDPVTLLRMGTLHGAAALGLDAQWFTFRSAQHPLAGVVAVEVTVPTGPGLGPLDLVFSGSSSPELLFDANISRFTAGSGLPDIERV